MAETICKNNNLNKIRSKYIVMKIFDNLNQNRLLNIIHYSKKYQKLKNINLLFYKNEFLKIEIEIIPKENTFGQFINIPKKNTRKNIHIYFNDNEKEIENESITKDDNVSKIIIIINSKTKSLSEFFYNCKCIKKMNFIKYNRDDIKDMRYMFGYCSSLEEINLSKFNTNNVINMKGMFECCSLLKEINLSNFNTNNVINMSYMFFGCSSLKELNLSKFNTNNVINMSYMFYGCSSLKKLNISDFNSSAANISWMLNCCSANLSLICKDKLIKKEYEKLINNKYIFFNNVVCMT